MAGHMFVIRASYIDWLLFPDKTRYADADKFKAEWNGSEKEVEPRHLQAVLAYIRTGRGVRP